MIIISILVSIILIFDVDLMDFIEKLSIILY